MPTEKRATAATTSPGRCPTCKRRHKRTSEANRRLWAIYAAMSDKLRPDGKTYSPEQYHLYAKTRFLGCRDMELPGGKTLAIPNSSADLDADEFADFMASVEALAAEHG